MKVGELIELLKTAPQDLEVLVPGYEGGFDDITRAVTDYVTFNANKEWWMGSHDVIEPNQVKDTERPNALLLRTTRNERKLGAESD